MARINFVLDDELEARFRRTVFERLGMKKGNIQIAVEDALEEWMQKETNKKGNEANE